LPIDWEKTEKRLHPESLCKTNLRKQKVENCIAWWSLLVVIKVLGNSYDAWFSSAALLYMIRLAGVM
jgi:hypothetical protein